MHKESSVAPLLRFRSSAFGLGTRLVSFPVSSMDLKVDLEDDLKKYLDAPPSQAIPPLSSSNHDDDDDDDEGPLPVIRGFEIDSDEDEDDGDSRCVQSYYLSIVF